MAGFKQAKSDFRLRLEAKDSSAFVVPEVMITLVDKLEAVGDPVKEQLGALEIVWVKVKCTKGEGFADNEKLQDFVEPAPVPDEELEIEFRRSIELTTLAELCYRNALRHHTNSALLLALARTATGDQWTDKLAKPKEGGDRIGIYGFTQSEWDAVLVGIPPEVDVKPDHIARARAQCEIASFVSGRHWQALIAARGEDVRAIDLYLAFLFGADVAIKILNADKVSLSTFLTAAEVQAVSARMASVVPGPAITADTQQNALIKALVDKLQTAFDFVKAFAESLMIDQQPAPQDEIIKTEDEIDHEDPIDGEDDPIGPDSPIVVQDVAEAAPQPGDGTLLISEAHLVALWKRSLFPIDGRGMILFGLRGCLPADPSATEFRSSHKVKLADVDYRRMRCTIGQWRPGKGFALFPGSTVPFVTLVDSATNRKGAGVNQMGRGRYKNYVSGWHKRREGRKKGHWALLQESDISFQRTPSDVNYTPDDPWQAGRPGDNIHCAFHMGAPDKLAESRYSSAGCQVVAGRVVKGRKGSEEGPWGKFIAPFLDDLDQSGFEYVLFDGRELERMVQTKMSGKTVVLRMGSEGAPVADLQQRLGLADPDGKFGPNTFRAVIKFQHQNFPKSADDGIVGPQTAERLGMTLPQFVFADAIKGLSVEEPGPGSGPGSRNGLRTRGRSGCRRWRPVLGKGDQSAAWSSLQAEGQGHLQSPRL